MSALSLGIWLALYIALAFIVGRLYSSFIGWSFVRKAFLPGIVLAGLGRQLACMVTGNDAKSCDCWRNAGPSEGKGAPEGGTVFRLLFAIGPFLLALAGVLLADWGLDHPISFSALLPRISDNDPASAGRTFFDTCFDFSVGIFHALRHQELGNVRFWLFIYLAASFVIATAPSLDDLKSVAAACAVVVVVVIGTEFLGFGVELHAKANAFWRGFSLLVAYTIFVLIASAILFLPVKLLRDSRKEK
jgi:hypothetical protein